MAFYSHCHIYNDGTREGTKYVQTHTKGVQEKALKSLNPTIQFNFTYDYLVNWLEQVALLHDLGKYTDYFQRYLFGHSTEPDLKNHAFIGSVAGFHKFSEDDSFSAYLAYYLIRKHHANLAHPTSDTLFQEAEKIRLEDNFSKQSQSLLVNSAIIDQELNDEIEPLLSYPKPRSLKKEARKLSEKKPDIQYYFFINYFFSLLLEADKLDASDTELYEKKPLPTEVVDRYLGKPGKQDLTGFRNLSGLNQNELRNYSRAEVLSHLDNPEILQHKLFTLTGPTGIGKTLTSLDFAIRLKARIKEKEGHEPQIIYALPFINIIEQNLGVYEGLFVNEDIKILAHYQYADIFNDSNEELDEKAYQQRLMTLDTWQSDIVITSFVQLFETIITNKNRLLKKFNHLAGAILILDEVQTLKLNRMPLIGAVLYYLTKFLNTRIILMTATKPQIFEIANDEILSHEGEKAVPKELLSSHETVFQQFQRTKLIPLLDIEFDQEETEQNFVDQIFAQYWDTGKSCLIVCNKVSRAINTYDAIQKYLNDQSFNNPVFHLSTNILPKHRQARIESIKEAVKDQDSPIVVATQVVEAGVDLDFDIGFRDVGPVDSIIQVAGRINRNNSFGKKHSPIYLIDFGDCVTVYGSLTYEQVKRALNKSSIPEESYLEVLDAYYTAIHQKKAFETDIFYAMKTLNYDNEDKLYTPVNQFRIIESAPSMRSVFVEYDEAAAECLNNYRSLLDQEISKQAFDRDYKRLFNQHIITVPEYFCEDLTPIHPKSDDLLWLSREELLERYDFDTGFIRDERVINTEQSVML
jgi:CRISPR-associated endonuclease/helicase Cas3